MIKDSIWGNIKALLVTYNFEDENQDSENTVIALPIKAKGFKPVKHLQANSHKR